MQGKMQKERTFRFKETQDVEQLELLYIVGRSIKYTHYVKKSGSYL